MEICILPDTNLINGLSLFLGRNLNPLDINVFGAVIEVVTSATITVHQNSACQFG